MQKRGGAAYETTRRLQHAKRGDGVYEPTVGGDAANAMTVGRRMASGSLRASIRTGPGDRLLSVGIVNMGGPAAFGSARRGRPVLEPVRLLRGVERLPQILDDVGFVFDTH
jgi:hypothetical protein